MLREMIIDFMLFSGIEGFILCLFFEKVGECRRFKWYEWLLLSMGNCLISKILPPTIYQCVCIIWMAFLLKEFNKNISTVKILKIVVSSLLMFYIVEVIYCIIIQYTALYDILLSDDILKNFILLFPTKILEIFISWKGSEIMKIVAGGVVRK